MNIYNSLTLKKEELPLPDLKKKVIRLFVCGPTVYDYPHIGNTRTFMVFDIFARYLRSRGVKLFYLQNITDIDDKIINRAKEEKTDWKTISRRYEKIFMTDMKRLGITSVDKYARATDFIPQIVAQVKHLTLKKHAYLIDGDGYYFDLKTFPEYGKLAGRTIEQAEDATSRIDASSKKRNRGDFCLWKLSQTADVRGLRADKRGCRLVVVNGEPAWTSELGVGRPGWHIEDTAITEKFFGPQYEIHGGALDLKFPHHEAEIAQQESASGKKPFVQLWMHAGFLFVNGRKMSKSLGNFVTIEDFLRENSPEELGQKFSFVAKWRNFRASGTKPDEGVAIATPRRDELARSRKIRVAAENGISAQALFRWMVLAHHYRSPMDYTPELVRQSYASLEKVHQFVEKLAFAARRQIADSRGLRADLREHLNPTQSITITDKKFSAAMDDDFNTPLAISHIFELMLEFQEKIWQFDPKGAKTLASYVESVLKMLGIVLKSPKIPRAVASLATKRESFRSSKQFIQSDALRKEADALGFIIEDTPAGPFIWPKS